MAKRRRGILWIIVIDIGFSLQNCRGLFHLAVQEEHRNNGVGTRMIFFLHTDLPFPCSQSF